MQVIVKRGVFMKNTYKLLGIIAFVVIIGFLIAACYFEDSPTIITSKSNLPKTAGLYLGAPSTLKPNSPLVMAVTTDEQLAEAFTDHVLNGTGEYTLLIDKDLNSTALRTFAADQKLTIIGIGGTREIANTASGSMFYLNGNDSFLTLGENITLKGNSITGSLIFISNGMFTMLDKSKITEHSPSDGNGAVLVNGTNAIFEMKGGQITGNVSRNTNIYVAGGVVVTFGTFTMTGGSITGNTSSLFSGHRDMYVNFVTNTGTFTLSGNTIKIGHIVLNTSSTVATPITTAAAPFNGNIEHLYLYSGQATITAVASDWLGKTVISGTGNRVAIRNRITTTSFMTNTAGDLIAPIAATHNINTSGVLVAN